MASYAATLPMNIACPKCGWYGNDPDSIGTHAPCDICPACRPNVCQDWLHPLWATYQESEKDITIRYDNTVGPGSLVWMYGKSCKGTVTTLDGSNFTFRVQWDDGTHSFHKKEELHRITRCTSTVCTSTVPLMHHKWIQHSLMDDICTECGEIAFGSTGIGGVSYPKTACPGKSR